MMGYGFMGGGLLMLFFWVFIIGGIVWAVIGFSNQRKYTGNQTDNSPDAKEILDRRYAQGEITKEQYDEMKIVLNA